jgi:glycosyltransferase involved in cell wall biosynthesis
VLDDGATGLLVASEDALELGRAILRLLSDREEAEALGSRARAFASKEFDLAGVVRRTEALYEEVLAGR